MGHDQELTVLSLGGGVQSSTVLLMAEVGDLPKPGAAIFADTGWEPKAVYDYLDWLRGRVSIPIYTVDAGNLREKAMASESSAWMPLYIRNKGGGDGMLRRQCTKNHKIMPIRRRVRELMKERGVKRATQWIGISLDEVQRMRDSDVKYLTNAYPLIDKRMTRDDCVAWLTRHDFPIPAKSSCIGCPYHDNAYWRDMKLNRPEEWKDACAFDDAIRDRRFGHGQAFLHRKRIPLRLVDLTTPAGQLSMFDDECHGVCGVWL